MKQAIGIFFRRELFCFLDKLIIFVGALSKT